MAKQFIGYRGLIGEVYFVTVLRNMMFSCDVTAAILVSRNKLVRLGSYVNGPSCGPTCLLLFSPGIECKHPI